MYFSHQGNSRQAQHAKQLPNISPWLDSWNLIPGDPWQKAIEAELESCSACLVFIGPTGIGPWQNEEMRHAIERRVASQETDRPFRVIPVMLPKARRPQRSQLPKSLTSVAWVEFRSTLDDPAVFRRLLCGIRGVAPGPGVVVPATDQSDDDAARIVPEQVCPYRGLDPFQPEHAQYFFGREVLVQWLLEKLRPHEEGLYRGNRFLAILGASGSGKSSVARAGLIPAIRDEAIAGSAAWPVVLFRPGKLPLESLAVALSNPIFDSDSDDQRFTIVSPVQLIQDSVSTERALHLAVRSGLHRREKESRVVILVDQFEELFTACDDENQRNAFIKNLLYAATIPSGQAIVVLTMRADFYSRCASYPALAAAVSDHQELVGPMADEEHYGRRLYSRRPWSDVNSSLASSTC